MKDFINNVFPSYPTLYDWLIIVVIRPISYVLLGVITGYFILKICLHDRKNDN